MVKKFNLSEAAADILNKSVAAGRSRSDMSSQRLPVSVVAGQKEVGDIGAKVTKTNGAGPDASKGVPTATPPGATPPVGSEPAHKLDASLDQQSKGRQDLINSEEGDEVEAQGNDSIVARVAAKLAPQKMTANKGATFQAYEEEEREGDVVAEGMYEGKDEDEDDADDKEEKKKAKKMKKMMKEGIQEDINALLAGENLSEEFVSKASTIFEAAVMTRVEAIAEEVEAQLQEQFDEALEEVKEDFANKIDDYLNYMVEEWMKENELAIDTGLRSEIVEDFMKGLHNLFVEHYIDIPEEKVDVVEELAAKVEQLQDELNEQIDKAKEYKKELKEQLKIQAVQTACEGLTQTQAEKLKALAENVSFTSEQEFAQKLEQLKEAYAPTAQVKPATKAVLEEGVDIEEQKPTKVSHDPLIDAVAKSISKSVVK
jgi:hypothetical protein